MEFYLSYTIEKLLASNLKMEIERISEEIKNSFYEDLKNLGFDGFFNVPPDYLVGDKRFFGTYYLPYLAEFLSFGDEKQIIELARKTGAVVTVEEHQVLGGLGGAVAEVLSRKAPTPMEFIGMQDVFGESGKASELIEKYGMGVEDIKKAVKKVVRRK